MDGISQASESERLEFTIPSGTNRLLLLTLEPENIHERIGGLMKRMNRTSIELREKKISLHPALFNYTTALCKNLQIFSRPVSIPSKDHSRRQEVMKKEGLKEYPSNTPRITR
jgi:hypothetical protein